MNNKRPSSSRRSPTEDEIRGAVPPTRRVRELRVGLFVIIGLAGFFVILFTMTSPGTFRGRYNVLTHVDDAGGMRRGDAVTMRGVHIGRVRAFDLSPESGVVLTLEIDRGWRIPVGSATEVRSVGFLGGLVVAIVSGPGPGYVEEGTLLPGARVGGVLDVAGDMTDDAADVLTRMQGMLSDSTIAGTEAAITGLRDFLEGASDMTSGWGAQVTAALDELRRTAENVEGVTGSEEWQNILASAEATLARLDRTTETLAESASSLNEILGRMERGEGTLGKLSTSDSLYNAITAAAESLGELIDDVKTNPGRYLDVTIRIF